mgnify:CR=1 FL=1
MLDTLTYVNYFFSFVLAPLLFGLSWLYRRRFKQVVMKWRKPQMVVFTIMAFIFNLTLFVLGCLFMAIYWGQIENIGVVSIGSEQVLKIALNCWFLLAGVTLLYFGLQNFYYQYVTQPGIVYSGFDWHQMKFRHRILRWEDIKDYYLHSDYPITLFNFLVDRRGHTTRRSLKVPFYRFARFRALLDARIDNLDQVSDVPDSQIWKDLNLSNN